MKISKYIIGILSTIILISCDETTGSLGTSLLDNINKLNVSTDTFSVSSESRLFESVVNKSSIGYLGKVKDPQTGDFVTGHFLTQFHTSEDYKFPDAEKIVGKNETTGEIEADRCELRLYYNTFYGDSLATMKVKAIELDRAVSVSEIDNANFDPVANGFLRNGGLEETTTYTLVDQHTSETDRSSTSYINHITIPLTSQYTDKNGITYDNFGTYIMRTFYAHPEYFKNSMQMINNVIPGFYFQNSGGIGSMAYISASALNVYFRYNEADSIYNGVATFAGTEEVLQATNISTSTDKLQELVSDKTCTYLKTPAGIYTEVTLPIDDIYVGHENDTINAARLVLPVINNSVDDNNLSASQYVLMLPSDSINSFFENNKLPDSVTSYIVSYSAAKNTSNNSVANSYTFSNIASLVTYLAERKKTGLESSANWLMEHPNWNKVALIPVSVTQVLDPMTQSYQITNVNNNLSLSSTKLVGGTGNKLKLTVIYSNFSN